MNFVVAIIGMVTTTAMLAYDMDYFANIYGISKC